MLTYDTLTIMLIKIMISADMDNIVQSCAELYRCINGLII